MDPTNRGPEEFAQDNDGSDAPGVQRTPRDPATAALGLGGARPAPGTARTVQLVSGDFLLTVNPVDGSEIEPCPPYERPGPPVRYDAEERAELLRASAPPVPPGPAAPDIPLLQREEEREQLVRLLARGRSVRLTGSAGSGRTTLLDAVAADCADLAPDGVVRLSGYRRTPADLLYGLCAAVYKAPLYRPDRDGLQELVHEIGAVVVVDDLEFGGAALDELLEATPECAFVFAVTPDVAAPSAGSHLEEVLLGGLDRAGSLDLLARTAGRPLTEAETNWAGDLWFESEGLPLRFVQAAALLRQRDALRADPDAFDEFGFFSDAPVDAPFDAVEDGHDVPLPTLGESAAPAALLASRLGASARESLRFAVALGGEVPHQAHLPALVGDTRADAALGELLGCALISPVGSHYRLAAGVLTQLEAAGYGEDAAGRARTAARHYAWWTGHPSVTTERATAEADAVLAAMAALVSGPVDDLEQHSAAVELARSATPAFAAGLHWGAWERALRIGSEAARLSGEVAEEAYFHHELGVLALCAGNLDRARAELDASIALRGALADKRGTVSGRRALALVTDREGGPLLPGQEPGGRTPAGEEVPAARHEESASPPGGVAAPRQPAEPTAVLAPHAAPHGGGKAVGARRAVLSGARRNLVAAGAGALLAGVLGTVVTLGATSGQEDEPGNRVKSEQSANEGDGSNGLSADEPATGSTRHPGGGGPGNPGNPGDPGSTGSTGATGPGTGGAPGDPSSGTTTTGGTTTPPGTGGTATSPTTGGTTSPTTGGSTSPTTGGSTPPTTGGSTSPTTGGSTSPTTGGSTPPSTGGSTTGGTTAPSTDGGTTTTGGTTGGTSGSADGGTTTTGGAATGGTTGGGDGGSTTAGTTAGTSTTGGTTAGTSTTGGTTAGTSTTGGTTAGASPTSSAPAPSGSAT
ncbi:ATP-binding protein [Streptomyces sannanensis]